MPWTLSHPAAVLSLRRLGPVSLDFPALAVGSMTPDVGYYIGHFELADLAHTLRGSFIACIPTGVIILVILYTFSRPVCYALPKPHRQSLLSICPEFPGSALAWCIILFSVLLGAWTHNFWDAFTHKHGWFAERIPWLRQPVITISSVTIYMALLLQQLSTVVGFAIILVVYVRWLRTRRLNEIANTESDTWRYLFWFAIFVLALAISLPAAVHFAKERSFHGFLFVDSVIFRVAIYAPRVAVPVALVGTAIIYSRRPR